MKLLKDRILVKPLPKEDNTSESGIILSNKPKNSNNFEVVIIGPEAEKSVKIGDVVRKFENVPGIPLEYNGVMHLLLSLDSEVEFVL